MRRGGIREKGAGRSKKGNQGGETESSVGERGGRRMGEQGGGASEKIKGREENAMNR